MTQSCKVRSEVASYGGPSAWRAFASACTVYMKISPRPVAMGPISGSMPAGNWLFTCCRRSLTRLRAKYRRSEEHTSELQSLMRISYAVFCLKKKKQQHPNKITTKQ